MESCSHLSKGFSSFHPSSHLPTGAALLSLSDPVLRHLFYRAHLAETVYWSCSGLWVPEWMNENQGRFFSSTQNIALNLKAQCLFTNLSPSSVGPRTSILTRGLHPTCALRWMRGQPVWRDLGKNQQVHQWEFKLWGLARKPGKRDKFSKYQDVGQYSKDEIHWYYSPSLTLPSNSMFHLFPLQCTVQMFHCSL